MGRGIAVGGAAARGCLGGVLGGWRGWTWGGWYDESLGGALRGWFGYSHRGVSGMARCVDQRVG